MMPRGVLKILITFWALVTTFINEKSASKVQFAKIEIAYTQGLHTNQHNIANLIEMNQTIKLTLFMKTHEQHKLHEEKGLLNFLLLKLSFCPMSWFCNIPGLHIFATNKNVFIVKKFKQTSWQPNPNGLSIFS